MSGQTQLNKKFCGLGNMCKKIYQNIAHTVKILETRFSEMEDRELAVIWLKFKKIK